MRRLATRHWPLSALAALCTLALLCAMLAPLKGASQALLLAFPAAANEALALPTEIRLTRGVQDVLLLRNEGRTPVVFGPLRIGPGRETSLPFGEAGLYTYACPPVVGKLVRVRVVDAPDPGWGRLRWRLDNLRQWLRYLPLRAPDD
ncbi:hypothetical protein [Telluria beijingensis]|uniref:hypothetical protein n=1 Tax=Telluria beijingensis TaxID=3068633 RepID=UPI0027960343|nr:hypothetical protein [Massilia sp. REN29]